MFAVFVGFFGVGLAYGSWSLACRGGRCPAIDALDDYTPRQTSKLYDVGGRFIAEIGLERRTLIKVQQIPPVVRSAFLITEDKRFYSHAGIDWRRVFGALLRNIRSGSWAEGFSTVTMQLARNVFPERISREKTLVRKLKEAKVARAIEARFDKDRILELYLNQIYLGNGAYGVETAAQRYFGKSARQLNLAEAATLAALPKGPERYNPRRFPERAVQRRNLVIELMRQEGTVSDADASLAKAYPLRLARRAEAGDVAPYFVEWVRQQLDGQFGQRLYEQGLKVYTTLDVDMQLAAERAMERQLRAIESGRYGTYRHQSYARYLARNKDEGEGGANSPYLQGAFIALDPRTGAVRALVGGRDFDDSKFNRATQALRQPGSTFKPIVYAAAVQQGRSPATVLDDGPLAVPQSGGGEWRPQNFDNTFAGKIPLRRALYQSRNLATIRLGMELGEQRVIEMARRFGLTTPIPAYPSIHIGAAEVYPVELVAAYSTFASLGTRSAPLAITRVENAKGEIMWEPPPAQAPIMSAEEAWLMVDVMKDVVRRGTAAGSVGGAGFRVPAGGKTGTTNDGSDVWFIGYTPDLVAGVWMGFDRPRKIKANAQGGSLAAPAWTAFMTDVYRRRPAPADWARPAGIATIEIDVGTGYVANPYCPRTQVGMEVFIAGTEPVGLCPVHSPYAAPTTTDTGYYGPVPPGYPPPTNPQDPQSLPPTNQSPVVPAPGRPLPSPGIQPSQPPPMPPPGTGVVVPPGSQVITPRPRPAPRDTAIPTRPPVEIPPPSSPPPSSPPPSLPPPSLPPPSSPPPTSLPPSSPPPTSPPPSSPPPEGASTSVSR